MNLLNFSKFVGDKSNKNLYKVTKHSQTYKTKLYLFYLNKKFFYTKKT